MEILLVVLKQTVTMFLLMAVGFVLYRSGKLTDKGNGELGTILLYVTLPCVIVNSYLTEATRENITAFGITLGVSVVIIALSILASRFAFGFKRRTEHFCSAFSNAGFIGIPVIEAALGASAVFYVASFIAILNVMQWVYGAPIMSEDGKNKMSAKLWQNPVLIASVIGIVLFFTQLPLPGVIKGGITFFKNMNTPLAMLILGAYLAKTRFVELFTDKWAYICSGFRLVAVPIICFAALSLMPARFLDIKLAILIAASAPVGSNAPIFAERSGRDSAPSVRCVSMSTVFSIITLPVLIAIARAFWA